MGLTLRLVFDSTPWTPKPNGQRQVTSEEVRLDNSGRIRLKSRFILNGVCVQWQGYMDSNSLSGRGRIVFDADRAEVRE
uniref:LPS export ABC transporter periplasmic protein LptC n=1 Tax=Macrostomum lignano TaxID=282301 RepID=A0A1I8IJ77_9PLAT